MLQDVINPANFSEIVGQVAMASAPDVEEVMERAQIAFETWSRTTPEERSSRLRAAALDLRNALSGLTSLFVRENGKPIREAQIDIQRSIELMEIIATDLPAWSKPALLDLNQPVYARRRPRGLTAVISPWNSPVLLSFKRFVPAIASGNTAIVKPSSYCPLAIMQCIDIINRHLPSAVLRGIAGSGKV